MAKQTEKTDTAPTLTIPSLEYGVAKFRIYGLTPLIQNRMSEKTRIYLLIGGQKKTAAEKKDIKHEPFTEFRGAIEMFDNPDTAIGLKLNSIKAAMCGAALRTPGIQKTEAKQLIRVPGEFAPLYGVPQIRIDTMRSADMNRTPDERSRPCYTTWGAEFEVHFIRPLFDMTGIATLLRNAGIMMGIGDSRQEKGKHDFGCFRILNPTPDDTKLWTNLIKTGGKKAQRAAIENPESYNQETAELMKYYDIAKKKKAA